MKTLRTAIVTLALAAPIILALAARARADVYVLDIVSRKAGVSAHVANVYSGALQLVARRHGGVRVSSFHEASVAGDPGDRFVILWRFPSETAVEDLLADPNYQYVAKLRERSFDGPSSATLQLVADRGDSRR